MSEEQVLIGHGGLPRYVGIHEAGHAVASWHLANERKAPQGIIRIALRTSDTSACGPYLDNERSSGCLAIVESANRSVVQESESAATKTAPILLSHRITILLAGPIAVARYRHQLLAQAMSDSVGEWMRAQELGKELEADAWVRSLRMRDMEWYARAILERRWPIVLELARDLRDRRVLEGDKVLAIIEAAAQYAP